MDNKVKISERVLLETYAFLDKQKYVELIAQEEDLIFIEDGSWLKDAAVIDVISSRQGSWDVSLVFANYKNPLQLIVRNIARYFGEQKAKAAAFYLKKEAAMDRRGTLTVSIKDLNLCSN